MSEHQSPDAVEQAIPVLRVDDAAAAARWYARLGFAVRWEHRFEPGLPVFAELARGPMRLFLSEHRGDAPRRGLVYLRLTDPGTVRALAAEFGAVAERAEWGMTEVELTDPAGNRVRIGA